MDWKAVLLSPTGGVGKLNFPQIEQDAVRAWLDELRAGLVDPDAPDQVSVLGKLGVLMFLDLRLRRKILRRSVAGRSGDVLGTVGAWSTNTKEQRALMADLRFRPLDVADADAGLQFAAGPQP